MNCEDRLNKIFRQIRQTRKHIKLNKYTVTQAFACVMLHVIHPKKAYSSRFPYSYVVLIGNYAVLKGNFNLQYVNFYAQHVAMLRHKTRLGVKPNTPHFLARTDKYKLTCTCRIKIKHAT